jgi:glycyl-tRNA synthetase beta chain
VSLSLAVGAAAKALLIHKPKKGMSTEQEAQVVDFILDRAKFILRDRDGFAYDEVNAVFRAGAEDLVDAQKRLVALKSIRKSKNFEPLAVSFKRVRKILEKADLGKDGARHVQVELFDHDAERELYAAMREAAAKVQTAKRAGKYQEALEIIAGLRKAVDGFFEKVMVMAEDERIRTNRLTLLSDLLKEFTTVADFSEIGSEERR